jgi:hypothetical protein
MFAVVVPLQNELGDTRGLSIAIPASLASDTPHLREKTAKLGAIARAASMFGVNQIILYPDQGHDQTADLEFCAEILRYLETPQYLRKRMFKLSPVFRFTGILPPLQTPHHNVSRTVARVRVGDLREGLVISRTGHDLLADIGLEKPISVPGNYGTGERVTIRIVTVGRDLRGEIVERPEPRIFGVDTRPTYWGYRVHRAKSLGAILKEQWDLKIGTSRYGTPIQEVLTQLSKALKISRSTFIAFGSPRMGLKEILAAENLAPNNAFHYFVNMVPDQQILTVRTEEALLVSLGILNLTARLTE